MSEEGNDAPTEMVTSFVPGYVPGQDAVAKDRESTAARDLSEGEKWAVYEKFREDGRRRFDKAENACLNSCWRGFWCLVPDVVEDAGNLTGKALLRVTVETINLLTTVASLDPKKLGNEIKAMFGESLPEGEELDKFKYNADTGRLPGRLTAEEMIYCCRLSLLAYITRDAHYHQFFAEHREKEMLNHVFSEHSDEVHQIFLVQYICSLFYSDTSNPRFGYSKGIGHGLEDMSLELVRPFDIKGNEGYIAKSKNLQTDGGDIVIAFQGTASSDDMMKNFHGTLTPFEPLWDGDSAGFMPCLQGRICCMCCESAAQKRGRNRNKPMGKVHTGFYNAFLSVRDIIQSSLEALLTMVIPSKKNVRVVVTGHSLGGALATLCTAWLMQWFRYNFPGGLPDNLRCLSVTFGQPKVGDDDFVNAIDDDEWTNWDVTSGRNARFKTYRIFTPLDPVVTTPPVALGFRHSYAMCMMDKGSLYFLPQSLGNSVDTTSEGIRRAIDQGMQIMAFHDLFNYLEAVMHFADINRGEKDMDAIFGEVDYQSEVCKDGWLEKF